MKPRTKSHPAAASTAPGRIDDAAFRAEIGALEQDPDIVAFATHFRLPRGVVRGWRDGHFVPRPELRQTYVTWVRAYVTAQRAVRQRVTASRAAAEIVAAKVAAKVGAAKTDALSKLTPAQRAALARSRSQTG